MRYAQIRNLDISNGEGVGVALFVQGCHFHCRNCFNSETWDFKRGQEWTAETHELFMQLIDRPYIQRVTILGGEPFCEENRDEVLNIIRSIRLRFRDMKKIWVYTGYKIEELPTELVLGCNVVVDGQYIDELKDFRYPWAGSTNQRVIDVPKTILEGKIILYTGG